MSNIQAIITQENATITCNFEQVKKAIQDKLAQYKGAVFTEDSKTYAKKEVASLRAEKKSLQDNMREAKKQYMVPWNEFEVQAKTLIRLYDEPITFINGQVQAFEEKRIAEKKKLISEIYQLVPKEVQDYIPLARIYNSKWENATYREKDIRKDISEITEKILSDLATIQAMGSEAVPKALKQYKDSLSLADAVAYINDYERQKREILAREQERKRREEEARIRREERKKLQAEQKAKAALEAARQAEREKEEALWRAEREKEEAARRAEREKEEALQRAKEEQELAIEKAKAEAAQKTIESFIPDMEGGSQLYEYRISLSDDAKEKLEMYMDSIGIEWELI